MTNERRFWEWCGIKMGANGSFLTGWFKYPDCELYSSLPDITEEHRYIEVWDSNPAQALFKAILKVIDSGDFM